MHYRNGYNVFELSHCGQFNNVWWESVNLMSPKEVASFPSPPGGCGGGERTRVIK